MHTCVKFTIHIYSPDSCRFSMGVISNTIVHSAAAAALQAQSPLKRRGIGPFLWAAASRSCQDVKFRPWTISAEGEGGRARTECHTHYVGRGTKTRTMVSRNGRDGQNSILHTEILSVFFSHLQVLIAFHEIFIRPSECCVRKLPSPCHQWCQLATAGAHSSWKLGRGAPLYTGMDIGRVTFDRPFVRTGNEKEDDEKHVCLR